MQEPSIRSFLYCVVFAATENQKWSEVGCMASTEKLVDMCNHLKYIVVLK